MKKQQNKQIMGGSKIYWIYAIIALIFVLINLSSVTTVEEISETEFFNKIENNEIKKVIFVTNAGYAEVELRNREDFPPHLKFRLIDIKDIKEQIRLKQTNDYKIEIDSREENKILGEIIGWILPLIIFIGIWMFIMKRMSGFYF